MAAISHDNNIQVNGANKVTLAPINNHFEAIRNSAHPLLMLLMLLSNNKNKNNKLSESKPSTPVNKRNEGDVLLLIWELTQENRDTDQARQESVIASVKEEQVTYDAQIKQWKEDQEKADKIKITEPSAAKFRWSNFGKLFTKDPMAAGMLVGGALGTLIGPAGTVAGATLGGAIGATVQFNINLFNVKKDKNSLFGVRLGWGKAGNGLANDFKNMPAYFKNLPKNVKSCGKKGTQLDQGAENKFNSMENTTIKLDQAASERTQQKMDMEMQTKFSTIQADETSDVNMSQEVLKLYTSTHNVQS